MKEQNAEKQKTNRTLTDGVIIINDASYYQQSRELE